MRQPTQLISWSDMLKPSFRRGPAGLDQPMQVPITRLPRVAAKAAKYWGPFLPGEPSLLTTETAEPGEWRVFIMRSLTPRTTHLWQCKVRLASLHHPDLPLLAGVTH